MLLASDENVPGSDFKGKKMSPWTPKIWSEGCAIAEHSAAQDVTQISLEQRAGTRGGCSWEHPFSLPGSHTLQGRKKHYNEQGQLFPRELGSHNQRPVQVERVF